jgi:tetratricopeptide (TPR) repeat protein
MARILFRMIAVLKNLPRPVVVFIIIAATFLVYAPALRNGFVWDDTALILRDPLIRSWVLIPEGFRHFLFLDATASNFYRPLQRLTFVADYQLYAFTKPWGWHLTSIGIHAAAAVALFFLAVRIMGASRISPDGEKLPSERWALAAALLWAIHPLHTSAVTYISGRADPLAALFEFSGLALGLASLEKSARASWPRALGAAACFLAAMLSKESGIVALPIWFLMLAWQRQSWLVIIKWVGVAACIVGIYCGLRYAAEKTPPPASSSSPAIVRPILAARAWAGYAALLVAPVNLHMERDVATHPKQDVPTTLHAARLLEYQTLAGVLLIAGFAFWWRRAWRNTPTAALCLGAFLIAYLPISDLLPLNATIAEHWLYVPSAFLFIAALLTLRAWLPGAPSAGRVAVYTLGAVWYSLLVFRTAYQQQFWRDQRAFITHTMAAGGDTARMRMNLGALESSEGHNDLALARYREAIERSPDLPIVWLSYASVLLRARDFEGARHALEKAEASPMLAAECRQTRAILAHLETGADTGNVLREAVELAPKDWPIRQRYVEYLLERNAPEAALRELRGFVEAHPFRGSSWKLLGAIMEQMRKPELALAAYRQAAELDVHDQESRDAVRRLESLPNKSARSFGRHAGNPLDFA